MSTIAKLSTMLATVQIQSLLSRPPPNINCKALRASRELPIVHPASPKLPPGRLDHAIATTVLRLPHGMPCIPLRHWCLLQPTDRVIPSQHSQRNPHGYGFEDVEAPLVRERVAFDAKGEFYETEYGSDLRKSSR
jgi:hypothetical protein